MDRNGIAVLSIFLWIMNKQLMWFVKCFVFLKSVQIYN